MRSSDRTARRIAPTRGPVADGAGWVPPAVGLAPLAGRRILVIVENLAVPFDRRVWQEARTLTDAGAQVTVICPKMPGYEAPFERIDGIDIHRHPLPSEARGAAGYLIEYSCALFWQAVLAWKVWWRHGFDVIHGCNPPDLIFLVALMFRPLGKRFVFDHHDINPELYEAKFGRRDAFWRLLVWAERLTMMTATLTISTNDSYRQIALERGRRPPERVVVVRSGPDLSRVHEVAPNGSWRRGCRYLVGYVGVMGAQEGIDLLLEAVAHIVVRLGRRDIQFCLVGDGPEAASLKRSATALGLDAFVTFTGRVSDLVLFEVLSTADVCVNPDRVNAMNDKSTMNKILEYMALGRPIVQFEVAEGRRSAGAASLYAAPNDPVDFAEKLLSLLDDPQAREQMGAFGRRRVREELAWEFEAPKLVQAYRRLFDDA